MAQSPVTTNVAEEDAGGEAKWRMVDGKMLRHSNFQVFWLTLQPTREVDSILSQDNIVKHDKSYETMVELVTIKITSSSLIT